MRENFKQCYHCHVEERLVPLVQSTIIHNVYTCPECRAKHYPWLKNGQLVAFKYWLDPTLMKPQSLEPKEPRGRKKISLKKNGMKKCQYNEAGHDFEIVRPAHYGMRGANSQLLSIKKVYENEISEAKTKRWMPGIVFVYWVCKHCGKKKFDLLSIAKTEALIKDL